ncbi:Uncharacterized protein HZ326_7156 [Fusarium oxysporum f. sp. albedinis]|nr:Uncharacterized protein HZ326_7156 [Fusarium oxysporum f. sp. albedinis]
MFYLRYYFINSPKPDLVFNEQTWLGMLTLLSPREGKQATVPSLISFIHRAVLERSNIAAITHFLDSTAEKTIPF